MKSLLALLIYIRIEKVFFASREMQTCVQAEQQRRARKWRAVCAARARLARRRANAKGDQVYSRVMMMEHKRVIAPLF